MHELPLFLALLFKDILGHVRFEENSKRPTHSGRSKLGRINADFSNERLTLKRCLGCITHIPSYLLLFACDCANVSTEGLRKTFLRISPYKKMDSIKPLQRKKLMNK